MLKETISEFQKTLALHKPVCILARPGSSKSTIYWISCNKLSILECIVEGELISVDDQTHLKSKKPDSMECQGFTGLLHSKKRRKPGLETF